MQLTNEQIKAVSEWMEEHGIDQGLVGKFGRDWMKDAPQDEKELHEYLVGKDFAVTNSPEVSEIFRMEERKAWQEYRRALEKCVFLGKPSKWAGE